MTVDVFGHDFDSLEKHPMGADFNSTGIWNSAHPEKFKAFFERIKAPLEKAEEGLLPEEKPVLRLK